MTYLTHLALFSIMFLFSGDEAPNPWKAKVAPAVRAATADPNVKTLAAGLDAAWRGDDFRSGLKLARIALEKHPAEASLAGYVARALWRAGALLDAEKVADAIRVNPDAAGDLDPASRVSLSVVITVGLARGDFDRAAAAADRLDRLDDATADELAQIMAARFARKHHAGFEKLISRITKRIDAANGYPETHMEESIEGLGDFFKRAGHEPINTVLQHGRADLPITPMIRLPGVMSTINGKGPFRLIVDTGGSVTLSLDREVAEQAGLKKLAGGSVRGVGGKDEAWQSLVDELQMGDIRCGRVMTRVFDVRKSTMFAADGIIGTGIFEDARMTFDFAGPSLIIAPSSDAPGPGERHDVRIVSDSKMLVPVTLHGDVAAGLLDSGADVLAMSPTLLKTLFPEKKFPSFTAGVAGVGSSELPELSLLPGIDLVVAGRTYENTGGIGLDVLDSVLSTFVGVHCDVLVGMPVFRDMKTFTVDFPKRRMWIDWLTVEE